MTERDGKATGWKAFHVDGKWVSEGSGKPGTGSAAARKKPAARKKRAAAKKAPAKRKTG
jgi:DNA topoisomerase-1